MTTRSLFDDLVFATPPLQFKGLPQEVDPSVTIAVKGTSRTLQFGSPWFLRRPPQQTLAARWPAFCGTMRAQGVPMFCRVEQFERVSASQVPFRLARRSVGFPFDPTEVRTADALELDCYHPLEKRWQWPLELGNLLRIQTFVQTLRDATAGLTPIGLSLPIGATQADLECCIRADCDFVTLIGSETHDAAVDAIVLEGLTRARDCFQSANVQIPILIVSPIANIDHAIKLLALGASAVCIDALLKPLIKADRPNSSMLSGGMLAGLNVPFSDSVDLSEVEPLLLQMRQALTSCLSARSVSQPKALDRSQLRGISQQVCELARVAWLN